MDVSLYELKKAILTPRTAYRRRTWPAGDDTTRGIYERSYYRRPVHDFYAAAMENPELLVDFDIDADSIAIDVGAYIGRWSRRISERYAPTIHAFEPAPGKISGLHELAERHPKVSVHAYGLGGSDFAARLALAEHGSSIYTDEGAFGSAEVQIRDAAAVFDELGLDHVDVMKVNIEGGEYDLLDRLIETEWLPRIRLVMIQFHEWHPRAYWRRFRIRRALSTTHEIEWDFPFLWELWRRADGVASSSRR
jgi:FkbM family methyltransferase